MKSACSLLAILLFAVTFSWAQSRAKVALVNSADAPGVVSADRMTQCLSQLAREWNLPLKDLPNVLVFHVSKEVADTVSVREEVAVRRNSGRNPGEEYFEVWLVGKADYKYVLALQTVLEYHFHFAPSDEERDRIVSRVGRAQTYTVDVNQGK